MRAPGGRRSLRSTPPLGVRRLAGVEDDVHGDGGGKAVQHLVDLLLRNAVLVPPLQLAGVELPAGVGFTEVDSVSSLQRHLNVRLHFPGLEVRVVDDDGRAAVVQSVFGSALVPFVRGAEEAGLVVVPVGVSEEVVGAQHDAAGSGGEQLPGPRGLPRPGEPPHQDQDGGGAGRGGVATPRRVVTSFPHVIQRVKPLKAEVILTSVRRRAPAGDVGT